MNSRTSRSRVAPLLMVLPAALPAVFVVAGGLGVLITQSVGGLPVVGPPRFSLDAFLVAGPELPGSLLVSLGIATASTAIALTLGFATAVVVLAARHGRLVEWVSTITVPIPHLVGAAAVGLLLSDGGVLARLAGRGGWPDLVGGPLWAATVFEFAWKESAFVALVVVATLAGSLAAYDETAAMLGAGPFARVRHVMLPLAAAPLALGGGIVFVYTMGSYEVPWLLGRAYPEPLPVLAVRLYDSVTLTARPAAAAAAVITLLVTGAVAGATLLIATAVRRWR